MWSLGQLKRPAGRVVLDLDGSSPPRARPRQQAAGEAPVALPTLPVAAPETQTSLPRDSAAGQYYLFTLVHSGGHYKHPEELGREGFWAVLKAAYSKAFPDDHVCHGGPLYGKVARELHAASEDEEQRQPHLHAACAFAARHRWKMVESILRTELRVKAYVAWSQRVKTPRRT